MREVRNRTTGIPTHWQAGLNFFSLEATLKIREPCFTSLIPWCIGRSFMSYFDANWWGLISVPVGLVVFFGPALWAWFTMK
jgi:hypothetical protein